MNLGLTGTGRLFPIVVDEEVGGEYCLPPNLTVSSGPLAQDVLPPASVAPQAQEVFRRELFGTAQAAFEVSAAPGAVRTNVAAFRAIAPQVALKLGLQASRCAPPASCRRAG